MIESMARDWSPFAVLEPGQRPEAPRALTTPEGVADRLRTAAFAELQAREAFRWGAACYKDAPKGLPEAWLGLAVAEQRHLDWLLGRMAALGLSPSAKPVSDRLWRSLTACPTAREFAVFMAEAEERGRQAGVRFCQQLAKQDPESAAIFGRIADEEVAHIALAKRFFPDVSLEEHRSQG
jgi:uncharacterized ferritin-like protein (DUF455 family)